MKRLYLYSLLALAVSMVNAAELANPTRSVSVSAREYFLTLVSFSNNGAATSFIATHRDSTVFDGNLLKIDEISVDGTPRYRVVLGPYASYEMVSEVKSSLSETDFSAAWIMTSRNKTPIKRVQHGARIEPAVNQEKFVPAALRRSNVSESNGQLSQMEYVKVNRIELDSSILVAKTEQLITPFIGRRVSLDELLQLKESINQLFVTEGYINSGVLLPDQVVRDGELRLKMIEGSIKHVEVTSPLRDTYITKRLNIAEPFNLVALQSSLKLLEQDPMVDRIDANISPGTELGLADLDLRVDTPEKFDVGLLFANNRSPSVGSENLELSIASYNLTGWGDQINASTSVTKGLDSQEISLKFPINSYDHSLSLFYSQNNSTVIEEPFDDIDVDSDTEAFGVALDMPIIHTLRHTLALHLQFENRKNKTFLLGQPFSFSEGAVNGVSTVSPIRAAISYVRRGAIQSFAGRFSVSKGTTAFDATRNPAQTKTKFTSYLGQAQYSRQLGERFYFTTKLLAQVSADPLLSVERFALGGIETVRGYRQNQIVRDNAVLSSVEGRYPLGEKRAFEVVTFADWGSGKNHKDSAEPQRDNIYSVGAGISYRGSSGLNADLYLAHGFKDFPRTETNLQDRGIHFRINYDHAF